jgi:hypothetical protein
MLVVGMQWLHRKSAAFWDVASCSLVEMFVVMSCYEVQLVEVRARKRRNSHCWEPLNSNVLVIVWVIENSSDVTNDLWVTGYAETH